MCHPRHHEREGPASAAQWDGSRSDFFRRIPLRRPSNSIRRRLGCRLMDLKQGKQVEASSGVPANGPQATETGRSVVWGASRWTSNDENRRNRRLGCQLMDLKRWKEGEKASGEDGNVGLVGKARSVEGDTPEKVATRPLPLRCACGPLPLMMPRVAHFSGASPSTDLQIQHTTVFWGASGWTSNAENGQNRRLRCRRMDLKRRKSQKFIKVYCFSIKVFYICDKHNYNSHG
jgi:hypothetical protein